MSEEAKILSENIWFGLISIGTVERLYPYPTRVYEIVKASVTVEEVKDSV